MQFKNILIGSAFAASLFACSSPTNSQGNSQVGAVTPDKAPGASITGAPEAPNAAFFLPTGSNFVAVVNWKILVNSPQSGSALSGAKSRAMSDPNMAEAFRIAEACGVDLFKDIETLTVAGDTNKDNTVVIALTSTLDEAKVIACVKEKMPTASFFSEVIGDTLLISPEAEALASAKEKRPLPEDLSSMLSLIDQKSFVFTALTVTEKMRANLGPASTAKAFAGHFSINDAGLSLKSIARFNNESDAASLKVFADGLLAPIKPNLEQIKLPESAISIVTKGNDLVGEISLTYPQMMGVAGVAMTAMSAQMQ